MKKIYLLQLPWTYRPRLLAFEDKELALEVCDSLNKDKGASSFAFIDVDVVTVYERAEIEKRFLNED